jgi:hypothetical protein
MAWKAKYMPEGMTVALTASGTIRSGEAKAQLAEAICLLKQHDTTRVLFDLSEAVWEASLPELYYLPDDAAALGAPWDARVAMVPPQGDCRNELCRFLELVCRNAGYDLRLFGTRPVAEQWLTAPPPASKPPVQPSFSIQT